MPNLLANVYNIGMVNCVKCGTKANKAANLTEANKAASSIDKEKLLKKYFHWGYPYALLIMCTTDCGNGCFKVLWCILWLILGASD